jgi:hypothetical protein
MPRDEFIAVLRRRPFQPFRLTTTNDEIVEVFDPAMVLIAGDDITVGVPDPVLPPPAASDLLWLGFENIVSVGPLEATAG